MNSLPGATTKQPVSQTPCQSLNQTVLDHDFVLLLFQRMVIYIFTVTSLAELQISSLSEVCACAVFLTSPPFRLTLRQVIASVAEAADRQYAFVVIATKALPDVLLTSKLLESLLSPSYTFPQPTYVLLQNGLGVEADLYQSLTQRKPPPLPQIITTAVYCASNLVGNTMEHPANIVSHPRTFCFACEHC